MFIFRRLKFTHKILLVLTWLLAFMPVINVKAQKYSRYEKIWALRHPFAAVKAKLISKRCYNIYNQKNIRQQLDSFNSGGKLDAYRHSFFMAAFSQKIKGKKVKKLGIAHEKGNYRNFLKHRLEDNEYPDSLACQMDLKNNDLGINIGTTNRKLSLEELSKKVIDEIKSGNAFVLKRNAAGYYLTCSGLQINISEYTHKWYIPKCLIKSNE